MKLAEFIMETALLTPLVVVTVLTVVGLVGELQRWAEAAKPVPTKPRTYLDTEPPGVQRWARLRGR